MTARELVGVVAVVGTAEVQVARVLWLASRFTTTAAATTSDGVIVRGLVGVGGAADAEAIGRVRALLAD